MIAVSHIRERSPDPSLFLLHCRLPCMHIPARAARTIVALALLSLPQRSQSAHTPRVHFRHACASRTLQRSNHGGGRGVPASGGGRDPVSEVASAEPESPPASADTQTERRGTDTGVLNKVPLVRRNAQPVHAANVAATHASACGLSRTGRTPSGRACRRDARECVETSVATDSDAEHGTGGVGSCKVPQAVCAAAGRADKSTGRTSGRLGLRLSVPGASASV